MFGEERPGAAGLVVGWELLGCKGAGERWGEGRGDPKPARLLVSVGRGCPTPGTCWRWGQNSPPPLPKPTPPGHNTRPVSSYAHPGPRYATGGGGVSQSFWERTGTYPEPFPGETHRDRRAPSPGRFGSVRSGPVRSGPSAPAPTRRRGGAAAGALSAAVARRAAAGSGGGNMRQSLTQQRPGGVPLPDSVGKCRGWG